MANKRGYDRLAVEGTVDLKVGSHTYRGWLQDICFCGFAGFSAVAQWKIAPGTGVEFNIGLVSISETLEGKGVVRHARELEKNNGKIIVLGVEFTDVDKGLVEYILKKLQLKSSGGLDRKRPLGPIDFIPY